MSESAPATTKATKWSASLWIAGVALALWFGSEWRPIVDQVKTWTGLSDSLQVSLRYNREPDYMNTTAVTIVNRSQRPVTIQKVRANSKDRCVDTTVKKLEMGDEHEHIFQFCGRIVEVDVTTDSGTRTYTFN
jgi:hypothetical protein